MCYSGPITYDAIGNPLSYWNGTLTWEGRQLKTLVKGSISASYKYDAQGLRSYKKVGTEESRYFYLGGKLAYEERGTKKFWYHYDALGALNGLTYKNGTAAETNYLVYTNNRGDVEALYTVEGRLYARYNYDAWGNTISITKLNGDAILPTATEIAYLNPIRYRGYYFDQESGLYYLKSRYYDPQVKRFLNPDSIIFIPGVVNHNSIAYCNNNPVNMIDSGGKRPLSLTDNPGEETPLPDNYYAGPAPKPSSPPSNSGGGKPSGSEKDSFWDTAAKVGKSVVAFLKMPYIAGDVGTGIGVDLSILGVDIGATVKSGYAFKMGADYYFGGMASVSGSASPGGVPLIGDYTEFTSIGCFGKGSKHRSGCNACFVTSEVGIANPSIGAGIYLGGCASIELGLDLNNFINEMNDIWG